AAAQAWLEDFLFKTSDGSESSEEEEGGVTPNELPTPSGSRMERAEKEGAETQMLREEVARLKASLEESERRCEQLEPLKLKLQHSQEKVDMLEQAARNQQQIFQVQMDLMDQSRGQYQVQLQELKERHAGEKQHWEDRSRAELEVRLRESQQEAAVRVQQAELRILELQAELQEAERRAQAEQLEMQLRVAVANLRGEARAAALAAAPAVRRASSLGQLNAELAAAAARLGQGSAIEVAPGATPSSVSVTFRPEDGCHLVAGAGYEASPGLTSAVSLRVDGTPAAATAEDAPPLHVSAEGRFCFEEDALRCSLKASPARVDGMPCIPSLQLGLGLGGVLGFMRPFGTHTCGQLVFSDLL
ncbi:Hypothetical protein (Fragment), partial [Durusdinium trenchii]